MKLKLRWRPPVISEQGIASYLARVVFESRHLLIVPNCQWPGSECDLLVVTHNLRIIDVEIKISRADLKADAKKQKWFENWDWKIDGPPPNNPKDRKHRPRRWPTRVWKHYYCLPNKIWMPKLTEAINPNSGILLLQDRDDGIPVKVMRRAKANPKAEKISAEDAIDIARLASLRMWAAYDKLEGRKR